MFWLNKAYAEGSSFMPPDASTVAQGFDALYEFLLWCSVISSLMVIGGLIYFAIRYRRKSGNDKTAWIPHNGFLEFLWSFIPFVFFMVMFVWGWIVYMEMRTMPKDGLEVHVEAKKWEWDFLYKSGRRSKGELVVPHNTPVKLIMKSDDVIHSFFVPAFRVKQDVLPGRYTALWFEATKLGVFQVFCTELCGTGHSSMLAKVNVLPLEQYEEWIQSDPDAKYKDMPLAKVGEKIYSQTCFACHSKGDDKRVGPGFKGSFGTSRKLEGGGSVNFDENYIRESLLSPMAKLSEGFPNGGMTQQKLSEKEILGIIEFLKSLK